MSRRGFATYCLIPLLLGGIVFADVVSLPSFKNPEAKKAKSKYDEAVSAAKSEYEAKLAAARKALAAELETAQKLASQAGELDEAVRIRDTAKEIADPNSGTQLQIVSAFYGQNISWFDVTERLRQAVKDKSKWSAVVDTKDWGEPAPDFKGPRTLMVRYSVGGKMKFKAVYQGSKIDLP